MKFYLSFYKPQAEVNENSSRINKINIKGTHIHTWFILGPTREKHEVLKTKNQEDFPFTQQKTKDITKMWIFSSAECKQFWKVIICNKAEIYKQPRQGRFFQNKQKYQWQITAAFPNEIMATSETDLRIMMIQHIAPSTLICPPNSSSFSPV